MSERFKKEICGEFSRASSSYHKNAASQVISAKRLYELVTEFEFQEHSILNPDTKILEIGCGTGIFSEYLVKKYPSNSLYITDISENMVNECRSRISPLKKDNIYFAIQDGEQVTLDPKFGRIFSTFTLHWLGNPLQSFKNLFYCLEESGFMAHSFPLSTSFKEWEVVAKECGIPYTANKFPELLQVKKELNSLTDKNALYVEEIPCIYNSALEFFQHFKQIGANTADKRISGEKLRKLVNYWDEKSPSQIVVTFQIAYVLAMRS